MSERICSVADCTDPVHARGRCSKHDYRWRRYGDTAMSQRRSPSDPLPPCSIPGCSMPTQRIIRGLCENHYFRNRKHGDPGPADLMLIRGQPVRRFWAGIAALGPAPESAPDLGPCWLWGGHPDGKGYGQIKVDGRFVMVHRFSFELLVGPIPADLTIDHLCMVKLCVCPAHLEPVTGEENTRRAVAARMRR